ncbi:outer membrane lipoprotein chaperone LolA [Lampropedia puyangensis]|uniref:Outer-membrane lipoprotein carrier protein n=1 Tax=Lampropedia puyangensis TaxID=1330072 RepID=A0A4S8F927_9BURK|nr:outer membrane lipoprotein chaperone LolA [Lampropedia puyangensis]THU04088.1 outer membrane lipoprotein chaperone LolA [Lampropedia puyangensis]
MKRLALTLALSLVSTWSMADGLQALDQFLLNVKSGQANFTQTVTAPEKNGEPGRVTKSSGTFSFERPGKFRFDYSKPFPQEIVGDGKTLWVYDEDLNQATSRDQQHALNSTPAAIISSATSRAVLEKDFVLQAAPPADGLEWVSATPKATDGQLRSVRMGFKNGVLQALHIEDNFAQLSQLEFQNFEANKALDASRFHFTPPAGADVIRDAQ